MKTLMQISALIYSVAFVLMLITGLEHAARSNSCNSKMARGEYIVPAYRLGCWLGEVPK